MGLIIKAANEGRFLTQNEIYPLLSYANEVTFGAVRFSIRLLEEQGLLKRVPQGFRRALVPTERGYDWFRPTV
jgi:repressor of nif and glnA expression